MLSMFYLPVLLILAVAFVFYWLASFYRRYTESLKVSMLQEPVDLFGLDHDDDGHDHKD